MFDKDFTWGVATASYQIEGAAGKHGAGKTIWDVFSHDRGRVYDDQNGDRACNHYELYQKDIDIMKELGIKNYRFSVNWARVLPDGFGRVNEEGIDFYNRLIDAMVEAGIEPWLTVFHWELPYEIYKRGGWLNPDIVEWFGDYAALLSERFSDRVKHFFTINEPQCFIGLSYVRGVHAPGAKRTPEETLQMGHNALKAHGRAVQRLREKAKQPLIIGVAPTGSVAYPSTDSSEDVAAAKKLYFGAPDLEDWAWSVAWWSDPIVLGKYPEDGLKKYERFLPEITDDDLKLISQPIDFYGQNIYNGYEVRAGEDGEPEAVMRYDGFPRTAIGWPITPEALYWGPKFLYERYKLPFYITENGISCCDVVSLDGKVHDPERTDFTERYLLALEKAKKDGADIRGYFHWSLLDNFEWADGYKERFGLVYVDYRTQERIIKDSGYWYSKLICQEI